MTTPSAVSTRRCPRGAKGVFGHVAENAVPRSIFFLRYCGGDFAQNFRDARSGRDLATINHRAPRRPQRRRRKSLRSGIVPRQGRVLGIPRVVLHAPAAPRPAQGWRRTDRSPQTSVAPYVWRTPPFLANGRNAVKPGLFCEPSGRVAKGPCVRLVSYKTLAISCAPVSLLGPQRSPAGRCGG